MLKKPTIRILVIACLTMLFSSFLITTSMATSQNAIESPRVKTGNNLYAPLPFYFPQCLFAFIDLDYHILTDNYTGLRMDYLLFSLIERSVRFELEYHITFTNGSMINGTFEGVERLYWYDGSVQPHVRPYTLNGHVWAFKDVYEGEMFGRIYIYDDMILEKHCSIY